MDLERMLLGGKIVKHCEDDERAMTFEDLLESIKLGNLIVFLLKVSLLALSSRKARRSREYGYYEEHTERRFEFGDRAKVAISKKIKKSSSGRRLNRDTKVE